MQVLYVSVCIYVSARVWLLQKNRKTVFKLPINNAKLDTR